MDLDAYEALGNADIDLTKINSFLTSKHLSVVKYYNKLIKIETSELNQGRQKEQESLLKIHLKYLEFD